MADHGGCAYSYAHLGNVRLPKVVGGFFVRIIWKIWDLIFGKPPVIPAEVSPGGEPCSFHHYPKDSDDHLAGKHLFQGNTSTELYDFGSLKAARDIRLEWYLS